MMTVVLEAVTGALRRVAVRVVMVRQRTGAWSEERLVRRRETSGALPPEVLQERRARWRVSRGSSRLMTLRAADEMR